MDLPPIDSIDDPAVLRAIIAKQAAQLSAQEAQQANLTAEVLKRDVIITALKDQLRLLRHGQHGPKSEKIERQIGQLELMLEEIETSRSEALERMSAPEPEGDETASRPARKPLPDNLPLEERVYMPACECPDCGGTAFLKAPDKVTQVLEHVPETFKVVRHIEKRMVCKDCDTEITGKMAPLPIKRGKPGPGLLAHIMVSKFDDHLPLYRLSEMFARQGIDISRSVMADWVGRVSAMLDPLVDAVKAYIIGSDRIHTDDTTVAVLDPGRGTTKTGRLWVYVYDGSGYQSKHPKAVAYYFSPDRKGTHPAKHLADFKGVMHADAYGGYKKLYGNQIVEAACLAHVRRKFHDVIKGKQPSTIANEALNQIGALYAIEDKIRGMPADERRAMRQQHAKPLLEQFRTWLMDTLPGIPKKQNLAEAVRYALSRWDALCVYLDDGRVEIDNNIAERAVRPIGLGRKNWLFAGSEDGGERIANILTVIECAKMHGLNPVTYLTDVIGRIKDHPQSDIDLLLPWKWKPSEGHT
ncbi:IS66 family transposase [Asticcacaulis sp.]|uniref:IS66 family transposase n=1 Tax=Asticcacaulis sp. TaxID=1872648 RepID=UPI0026087C9E|nr:IS66 family transposase [Asticcacaulis sp.]